MAYDAAGNLLSLTDPDGNTTAWTYDALNRVSSETNELGATRSFQYDAAGQQTRRTDRDGRVTVYAYDALGRMTSESWYDDASDADAGCENGTGSNQDDSCPSQFSPATNVIHYEYDAAGRLVSEWDAFSSYSYTYDALDRVVTETVANPDAPVVVFTTGYDPISPLPPGEGQGERALRTSFSATIGGVADFQRTYQYDALGQMVHIGQSSQTGGNAVAALGIDLQYDASGRLSGLDRYLGTALVATSTWQYDARGNLTSLLHAQGTTTLAGYTWTFDSAGRLTGATSSDGTVHYTYDATGQLTGADYTVGAGQGAAAGLPTEPPPDETYSYDANGNRTTVGQASLLANYITGPNNELLFDGTFRYAYDPEGNRTARFIWTDADADGQVDSGERSQITDYAWDNRNRLVSVTEYATDGGPATQVVAYTYDTHNRWVSRTVDPDGDGTQSADATYFVYDCTQIVLTFTDPDGPSGSQPSTLRSRLLWGPAVDQLLADEQIGSGPSTLDSRLLLPLPDHLNTIRDLAEFDAATGITAIVNHRVFDAYGQLLAQTNAAVDCFFAFTGRSFDEATRLQNNGNRWYDAVLGRWVSQDPYGFEAGDANQSRYLENRPGHATDPTGLAEGPHRSPVTRVPGVFGDTIYLNDSYFRDNPFGTPTIVCHGVTAQGRVGPANSFRFPGGPGSLEWYMNWRDTVSSGVAGVGIGVAGYYGVTVAGPLAAQTGAAGTARLMAILAARGREAVVLGSLTLSQIQGLIASSGDRVVTLFTRLSQSPAANRVLYTSMNPQLCNQIQHTAGRTQLFVGRIPHDLFQRLVSDGFIRIEQTQMGNVVDKAYVISAEAMPLLQPFFEQSGGSGLP
jgi:RHS repeat-associated protein